MPRNPESSEYPPTTMFPSVSTSIAVIEVGLFEPPKILGKVVL